MRATNHYRKGSNNKTQKARFHPVLVIIAALFLFCLPLNLIELPLSGIHHPAVAFSLLMAIAMICIGIQQIERQEQFSLTPLTYGLIFCAFISLIPAFYHHADLLPAILHITGVMLCLLLFITLQQFSFTYHQRQYLLWFPMLSGWVISLMWALWGFQKVALVNVTPFSLEANSSAIILLTTLALSAYLLTRTHIYKRPLTLTHILLLTTPLVTIMSLMALSQPHLLPITIVIVALPQLFMYKYCQKFHHILWNISALLGLVIANVAGWVQIDMSWLNIFSSEESSVLKQTLALLKTVQFEGVGIGQLATKQLLFGVTQQEIQPILSPYPSWLILKFAEGGIVVWVSFITFGCYILKRLSNAPNGTRLMLLAISLPTLYGITTTAFLELNPVLIFFFIIQLYWIDNLTTRYHRINISRVRYLTPVATNLFIATSIVVFSSVFLGEQAQHLDRLNIQKLHQYQHHPWWHSFYLNEREKRLFLQSVDEDNKIYQEAYLHKQLMILTKNPTSDNYQSLIDAAKLADHQEITDQLETEANLLFPARFAKPASYAN